MHEYWQDLKNWFAARQRTFPWRNSGDPYAVWISEIMLQQTRACVVVPYYQKWMERFPDIATLARAPLQDVIKCWEGLGYYVRARNIHYSAKVLLEKHQGKFPPDAHSWQELKGIGAYTKGAIASFAFHQKAAAVDANVFRVLCRYFGLEKDASVLKDQRQVAQQAQSVLPDHEPWIVNEAWIELGATLCCKKPACHLCPLQKNCLAYKQQKTHLIPCKSKKIAYASLSRIVFVLQHESSFLIRKAPAGQIMQDLHEFPYVARDKESVDVPAWLRQMGMDCQEMQPLGVVQHSFTRYRVKLYPFHCRVGQKHALPAHFWLEKSALPALPFSSGHKRILEMIA